jgi:hypothetical protein
MKAKAWHTAQQSKAPWTGFNVLMIGRTLKDTRVFPADCPFSAEQVLAEDFLREGSGRRVAGAARPATA